MADSLGQYLKRTRETKGWTLQEAAVKTRILAEYLQAVEEDNYARLPEEVFAKGFVRSYSRSLRLDENEVLQKFNESAGQFYEKRAERERIKQKLREEERRKKLNQLIVVGMVGAALVALLLITRQDRDRGGSSPESVALSAPTKKSARPESAPTRSEPSLPSSRAVEAEPNFSGVRPLEGIIPDSQKLVLDIEALERSWLLVQGDLNPPQDGMLSPGERMRWTAEERLTLTLGNAGGVRVSLNGKLQAPYGASGKVVKDLVFTR
jgi:cytoskeleton protein RodZ